MLPSNIDCVIINTGNLISSKELKTKTMQTPTEEVYDSVNSTLQSWLKTFQAESINGLNSVTCVHPRAMKVDKTDRSNLKISVKVFLESHNCEDLKTSVSQIMNDLDISVIDSLILALPPLYEEEKFSLEPIKPLWTELEKLVSDGKVVTIGVSDLDAPELSELYNWTQVR